MRVLGVVGMVLAPVYAIVSQAPSDASIEAGARIRVTVWNLQTPRVTIGRFISRDESSIRVLSCAACDTTRLPWSFVDRLQIHAGGNAAAFNVSKGAVAAGAIGGAIVTAVLVRRTACQGEGALICGPVTMFIVPLGLIMGTVPGIIAAFVTHERWADVSVRAGPP